MQNKKKKTISFIGLFAIAGLSFHFYQTTRPHQKHWEALKKKQNVQREIASIDEQIDPKIFDDFLIPETYKRFIEYDMEPRFWTDLDDKYLQAKAKVALNSTLVDTFSSLASPQNKKPITALLKENLIKNIVSNYIKTAQVFKIFNGTFQIDLNFTPKEHLNINYDHELSTNQLINFENSGSLYDELVSSEISNAKQMASIDFPVSTELYQYTGGSISIWLKLLDMSFNPLKPIPNPKKNAVKGFVRYRRYFKVNSPSRMDFQLNSEAVTSNLLHFKKNKEGTINSRFITVDIIKEFNLKNLIPKDGRMEIHFGNIVPNNIKKGNIIRNFFSKKEKKINTGELSFSGEFKGYRNGTYKSTIKKLVYDFKKKRFSSKSKISTRLRGHFNGNGSSQEKVRLKNKIKNTIIKKHAADLIEKFQLNRFDSRL